MASLELKGILKSKTPIQQISDKFIKRDFVLVIDNDTQYPQVIGMQVSQDKCGLLDIINVGDEVKVSFNVRGKEWKNEAKGITQYFTTFEAWRFSATGQHAPEYQQQGTSQPAPQATSVPTTSTIPQNNSLSAEQHLQNAQEIADDLPF